MKSLLLVSSFLLNVGRCSSHRQWNLLSSARSLSAQGIGAALLPASKCQELGELLIMILVLLLF